jgi:hypothetical protein
VINLVWISTASAPYRVAVFNRIRRIVFTGLCPAYDRISGAASGRVCKDFQAIAVAARVRNLLQEKAHQSCAGIHTWP